MKVRIVALLLFNESRKVGFGLWLFVAATILLGKALINSEQWILCMTSCSVLIGGGTVADTWLGKKPGAPNAPAA